MATLDGMKVAILAAEGFEQSELLEPRKALEEAGAQTRVVSPAKGEVQGWKHFDKGEKVRVDVPLEEANAADFDALMLPGGVANPDQLRMIPKAVEFVRAFFEAGKPVAAICHAPWTLIEAGVVKGRTVTSWPSLKTDLTNAGAKWVDQEVVTDNGLVTSRKPADIPAFNRKMIEEFAERRHASQAGATGRAQGKEQRPSA
ncbi:MAG TPA: type 1 glutamine amidotransferase domain-containing protein [Steroidobacteraceae bacterium]|jgi:protease I|nr:type 1 glutamine amidotransferase domain-containing protein [Steroidobacteraceae bacterium]